MKFLVLSAMALVFATPTVLRAESEVMEEEKQEVAEEVKSDIEEAKPEMKKKHKRKGRKRRKARKMAISACKGKSVGEACEITTKKGKKKPGSCIERTKKKILICKPTKKK